MQNSKGKQHIRLGDNQGGGIFTKCLIHMEYLFAANIVILPFEKYYEIIYIINCKLNLTLSSERSVCTRFHNYCVLPAVEVIPFS